MSLRINLLPPTRFQRAVKSLPEGLGWLFWVPFILFCLLSQVCFGLAVTGGKAAFHFVGRKLLRIKRRISEDEAIDIARRIEAERRIGSLSLIERLATYEVYIEIPPSDYSARDCTARRIAIDIQDGRILSSAIASCKHHHRDDC